MSVSYRDMVKRRAIKFRQNGYSYSYIARVLNLSKSTLSDWLKDIPFVPNQTTINGIRIGTKKSADNRHQKRLNDELFEREVAFREIGNLSKRDLFLLGIGLYLGEGSKAIESVRVINSDPRVIKIAIAWLKEIVGINNNNLNLALHSYPDNNIVEDIEYWSEVTGIPRDQFGKTQIDIREGKRNTHKLPHGTVQLRVVANGEKRFGVSLHRRIMGWIDSVSIIVNDLV